MLVSTVIFMVQFLWLPNGYDFAAAEFDPVACCLSRPCAWCIRMCRARFSASKDCPSVWRSDLSWLCFLAQEIRNDCVGMSVAYSMLRLQNRNHFHVLHVLEFGDEIQPMIDGLPVLFLDGRKVGSGTFDFLFWRHGSLQSVDVFSILEILHAMRFPYT
jgi:hypothetical protein